MLAIIGGSGLTTLSNLDVSHREVVRTPYGEPSGPVVFGQICGKPAMFLPRHGYGHTIPPHMVNYSKSTYFDGNGTPVTHIDFTEPYDRDLSRRIHEAGEQLGIKIKLGGVYAATQGPRLETAAEINRLERDGADLVGMTGMPEAALARELGLPYVAINVIANHAAGRGSSANGIHFESLDVVLQEAMGKVKAIIEKLVGCQNGCQSVNSTE